MQASERSMCVGLRSQILGWENARERGLIERQDEPCTVYRAFLRTISLSHQERARLRFESSYEGIMLAHYWAPSVASRYSTQATLGLIGNMGRSPIHPLSGLRAFQPYFGRLYAGIALLHSNPLTPTNSNTCAPPEPHFAPDSIDTPPTLPCP